ncbi:MAG: Holliday junction branch migration protein RuvA [Candidatus Eisenbacteria bacterium]|uniref:Holliday junction branch migration complex subunit RuvA n=1 Tax=Eiseniibacteriota bacterium TaxID=2212470 RepID=A0A948W761_UNCEI|nr:Holliday junction branch migration protein RuvA [Candidatus Eisenbacteria bacterium]MBU1949442.1 Holliday junction branch migration protein RuvA [Candidatus Eisenbacteria bacterium]MBU2691316.1 Holliday junction branch migration protein RuvA [Candidatus Eisenbacteria bacterium]
MISHLRGKMIEKSPTRIVIEVGGLGLSVEVPLSAGHQLGAVGGEVHLHTWLQVREDDLRLYGFLTQKERSAFTALMGIRGVGGRLALNILSHMEIDDLTRAVESGDLQTLQAVPGVGKKTAQRLLLELGGYFSKHGAEGGIDGHRLPWMPGDARRDAAEALVQLGYPPAHAREAIERLGEVPDRTADELIRTVLSGIGPTS